MRVVVANGRGFCFGVRRAVQRIEELLLSGERVYTDGDVVHNKGVMRKLINMGLKVISLEDIDEKEGVFVVRAHGLPPGKLELAVKKFDRIEDLTCPIVKRLFELAESSSSDGWKVVVFGREGHAEMEALKGYVPDAVVTSKPFECDCTGLRILAQTTSPWKEFASFVAEMLVRNPGVSRLEVLNTVCSVTIEREKETKKLSRECDLVLVVGGRHSANTGKLFKIASEHARALWIESPEELEELDLEGVECVAVVSGTSTPERDVLRVAEKIISGGKEHG